MSLRLPILFLAAIFSVTALADEASVKRGVEARFAVPFCPYCKSLDRALLREDDITIYTFLFPMLRPESADKSRAIWCAPDRAKAYYDFMLNGRDPALAAVCEAPVDKWLALGRR